MNVDTGEIIHAPEALALGRSGALLTEERGRALADRFAKLTDIEYDALRRLTPAERIARPIRLKLARQIEAQLNPLGIY